LSAGFLPRIEGHEFARQYFERALALGRLSHAYLFTGPPGSGKLFFALELAKALFCDRGSPCGGCAVCRSVDHQNHAGVTVYGPEEGKRAVDIETVRELCERSHYRRDHTFIAVLEGADQLTVPAANALLKTLEEPMSDFVVILTAASAGGLPPTVVSRCHRLHFRARPRPPGETAVGAQALSDLSDPSGPARHDPRAWLAGLLPEPAAPRERVALLIDVLLDSTRSAVRETIVAGGDDRLAGSLLDREEILLDLNAALSGYVNPELVLERVCAEFRV
jgi:DNA polymerase III delta prime subunit